MYNAIKDIPGIEAEMLDNIIGQQPFGVKFRLDKDATGMSHQELVDKLKEGDPPIFTRVRDGDDFMMLHAFGLNEGEEHIVGERIAALFK